MPQHRSTELEPSQALSLLGDLFRWIAPPAGEKEIFQHGLSVIGRCLAPTSVALVLRDGADAKTYVAATWGDPPSDRVIRAAQDALEGGRDALTKADGAGPAIFVLSAEGRPLGVLAVEHQAALSPGAHAFCGAVARALSAALGASRLIGETRQQKEMLARRNIELEALREFGGRIQGLAREETMLQTSLDLILEKLELDAGWIFWGEASAGRLELAASRGVSEEFVRQAHTEGIGSCLCLDVFETGRLGFARNTLDCPRLPHLVCGTEPMAHACIPLKFERGVLGVMNIANRPGRVFTRQELDFLETVGSHLCMAVDKAQTTAAENRRNAEARALASLARAIGGSLDRERILAAVGEYARELLSAERCAIFLGDGSGPLAFAYLSGPPLEGLEVGKPADMTAMGARAPREVFRLGKTLVVNDATEDPRVNHELAQRWNVGSSIMVPLRLRERLEGLLMVTRGMPSVWSTEEIDLADALAGQAALAIETSRLYREAQDALLRLQQAQYLMMKAERLAAIGTLASSLAHEVRNPLNSINLQLVLLERRIGSLAAPLQGEISGFVETARREITRLDSLVGEFLSLSSIDRIAPVDSDPEILLTEVLSLMTPLARQRSIAVARHFPERLPMVRLDSEKIKQVLINLIRNAIEAMPDGGTLTVAGRCTGGALKISVQDTGLGIDPGIDVYDFFMTTKRGGTGLGLPIARRIVEAHSGSLSYESEPGRGTTFTISLAIPQDAPGESVERQI